MFDALALPRVTAMTHQLYGLMLAVVDQASSRAIGRRVQNLGDLLIYHLGSVFAVISMLLDDFSAEERIVVAVIQSNRSQAFAHTP